MHRRGVVSSAAVGIVAAAAAVVAMELDCSKDQADTAHASAAAVRICYRTGTAALGDHDAAGDGASAEQEDVGSADCDHRSSEQTHHHYDVRIHRVETSPVVGEHRSRVPVVLEVSSQPAAATTSLPSP